MNSVQGGFGENIGEETKTWFVAQILSFVNNAEKFGFCAFNNEERQRAQASGYSVSPERIQTLA